MSRLAAVFRAAVPAALAITAHAASAPPARAQDPPATAAPVASPAVTLRYRFDRLDGKTATYTVETEQRVAQAVRGKEGGGEVRTWVRQTLELRFSRGDGGAGRVVQTPRRIEARVDNQGSSTTFDSQVDHAEAGGPFATLAATVGRSVTLEVTPGGVVRSVRGVPVAERAGYRESFLALPDRPLRPGDGWDRLEKKPMDPLGTIVYHFRYTLDGVDPGDPVRYRLKATIRAALEDADEAAVDLSDQRGEGGMVLDDDGLVRESTLESRLELSMRIPGGTQVQRLETRTHQVLVEVR
jgi:hypothetical protein